MLSTCEVVVAATAALGRGGAEPEPEPEPGEGRQSGEDRRPGLGVQEWPDGSTYDGAFVNGFKHGKGRYTWSNGEFYEGSFHKDYRHGDGLYCWPTGHKFTGKFYLNRKEGYGRQQFPDGANFQGLYHADQRFGPGVVSYADGRTDVGLWLGERLLRLCNPVEESFSLKNLPEYAAYMDPAAITHSPTQFNANHSHTSEMPTQTEARTDSEVDKDRDQQSDESFILPPGMESYSTDGDHLPLPPGRRKELDQHFHGELWVPDDYPHGGYERDPLSSLPLQARLQALIKKHRLQAENVGWDVAAVLSLNRESFGPKGPLEISSELLIQHASRGELQAVSRILRTSLVHPDVADSQGHSALIAATINCHNDVIQLLLDMGADVDTLNREGMSALAVCYVLYYPFQSLHTTMAETPTKTQVLRSRSARGNSPQISQVDLTPQTDTDTEDLQEERKCKEGEESIWETEREREERRSKVDENECKGDEREIGSGHTGIPQRSDTWETVRKTAAMKTQHRVRLNTLNLLLERGADPNAAAVPMPVLFLAIMAADTEAVRKLLLCGARTDIPLPPERKGLYPLHVAAALPGLEGPRITELLLHTIIDPDARACDHNEICDEDEIFTKTQEPLSTNENPSLKEGGPTALHMACQRDSDYQNASRVVSLLLTHRASTDLLWSGHSPLSLAIASGNDLAVEELLNGGADPNDPLGRRVGSALCALGNVDYHLGGNRAKLLGMLAKAGADILMPVMVGDVVGTAVDYAHHSFNQDLRIANTPFHALNMREREALKARRQLLSMMGDLLRQTVRQRERENLERDRSESLSPITEKHRKPAFMFCYHCGRSVSVKLTPCTRCRQVFYCTRTCKLKAWEERHKEECVKVSASMDGVQKSVVFESQRGPGALTGMFQSKTVPRLLAVKSKSPRAPIPFCTDETVLERKDNLKGNYSCN